MKQRYTKLKSVALAALTMGLALGAQAAKNTDCITFTSKGAFSLNANEKGWDGTLYWSTDQENWKEWTWNAETPLAAAQTGGAGAYNLYLYGTTANTKISGSSNCRWILTTNGVDTVACSGNIETLRGATGNDPSKTSMAEKCYFYMFKGCAALTAAPALPATTLAQECYASMLRECTALTAAPALPATTLAQGCYSQMFMDSTSLTAVPALPATTLATSCYIQMFSGCTALEVNKAAPGKEWKLPTTSTTPSLWNMNMFSGIKSGSTVPAKPAQNTTYYIASAPKETNCITFTAKDAFGMKLRAQGKPRVSPSLEYSTDQLNWKTVTAGDSYEAKQDGGTYKMHFRGTGNTQFTIDPMYYYAFTNTADSAATAIACSGNIMTLLDYQTVAKGEEPTMEILSFCHLFDGFVALTAAPALPATTLASTCYHFMFRGCTSLMSAPALPATTLAPTCYCSMFQDCTSLTAVPALPATTLAPTCYNCMFKGCTALEVNATAPGKEWKISATSTTATSWNKDMFSGIKSGSTVPTAPALNTPYYIASDYDAEVELGGGMKARDYGNGQVAIEGEGALTDVSAIADRAITNLYIGAGVTGVGANAFDGWRSLRSIEMGADCATIGSQAFLECFNLTNVTSKATGAISVGDHAFYRCNSLESMDFGVMPSFGTQSFTLQAGIYMKDGLPQVYSIPDIQVGGTSKRHVYGTVELGAKADWVDVTDLTDEQRKAYHFFKIVAE